MEMIPKFFGLSRDNKELFVRDRRALKRYELPFKLSYCDPVTKCQGETLTKNISKTGLRFPINARLAKGAVLDLKIEDPYSNKLASSKARIMWTEKFVTGDDASDVIYEVGVKLLKKRLWN